MKGEWGPYIVIAFFIYCMWEKSISSYWGINCLWALTFFNKGKAKRSFALETWDYKASNLESLCHEGEWVNVEFFFCKYESVLRTYHHYLKKYCQFWCKKKKCLRRVAVRIIRLYQRRDFWSCACWQRRNICSSQDRISRKIFKYFILF